MPKILIDKDDLVMALTSGFESLYWFLDKRTGEILDLRSPEEDEDDMDDKELELWNKVEENEGDRYEEIIPTESHDAFRVMEDFVDSLPLSRAKEDLYKALSRKSPFANFKEAICDYPGLREQWFKFQEDAIVEAAKDWLDSLKIEYEIVDRREKS